MRILTKTNSIFSWATILAATLVSIIAPVFSAHATITSDTLLITENSSTSLSVTWNGAGITPSLLANDHWQFTLPVAVHLGSGEGSFGSPDGAAIAEPGAGTLGPWNNVFTSTTITTPDVTLVDVQSDSATTSGFASLLTDGVSGNAGTDVNGLSIFLTFHDVGDAGTGGTVPDNSSTVLLALISMSIVFGMAKYRAAKAS